MRFSEGGSARAPAARRIHRSRIRDVRLWTGLLLIAGSVVAGAYMLRPADDAIVVLRATRDLSAGAFPLGYDEIKVSSSVAGDVYLGEPPPEGAVLRWPIAAGELIPKSALVSASRAQVRAVSVPVDPVHAPPSLGTGDVVDVWSTPRDDQDVRPSLVLSRVVVASVDEEGAGLAGEIGVVLLVPPERVSAVVGASRTGVIDLVSVPIGSQSAT